VQIYGKVNYATMWWDDGGEQNVYTVNNYNESTRTGIKGKAKIAGDWEGGFRLEWEYRPAASNLLNQFNDDNHTATDIVARWSQMYLANKHYGTLNWGLTATPKYDITKFGMEYISTIKGEGGGLSDTLVTDFRMNPAFFLRQSGFNNAEGLSAGQSGGTRLRWSDIARCYGSSDQFNCSTRRNGVAYSSPDFKGFFEGWNIQAGYFEDDMPGAAIRYKNTFNDTWLVAAGAAYEKLTDERIQQGAGGNAGFARDFDEWAGSAAIKHKPTGLFVVGVWSVSDSDDSNVKGKFNGQGAPQMTAWDVQGGIQRPVSWFGLDKLGETALWGGFSQVEDGFAPGSFPNANQVCPGTCQAGALGSIPANMILNAFTFPGIGVQTQVTGSEVNQWFIALDQGFSAAAMHVYLAYQHFDADLSLVTRDPSVSPNGKLKRVPVSIDDFDLIYSGGRIYF
jgi:predicted porin